MRQTLYLIGNGFDLFHGLPTSYADFKEFVFDRAPHIYRAAERYLDVRENWSDLEASLATFDTDGVIQDLEHFAPSYGADDWSDSGHHDFQYEVDKVIAALSEQMRDALAAWIRALPTDTVQPRLGSLPKEAHYLSFNYTDTLERAYGIPAARVVHIHGQASVEGAELVLGHAWAEEQRTLLSSDVHSQDQDPRQVEVNQLLDEYFNDTFKPSQQIIQQLQPVFMQLTGVTEVVILGHSLAEVDWPYLRELLLLDTIRAARWTVACRDRQEATEKFKTLIYLGVPVEGVSVVHWDELVLAGSVTGTSQR
jgi:hypothetical protein